MLRICTIILYWNVTGILGLWYFNFPCIWACKCSESWSCMVWTCLAPMSCVSKDSSCRVPSCVSAGMIPACDPVFGVITSSTCSSGPGTGCWSLLLYLLQNHRGLFFGVPLSLMTLLEKGIDQDMDVFIEVPIAANDEYNDCCDMFGITC